MSLESVIQQELGTLDFSRLINRDPSVFLDIERRADARIARFRPMTVEDRFRAFNKIGFRPHGLFVPRDEEAKKKLIRAVNRLGEVADPQERLRLYYLMQDRTAQWETDGVIGIWTGQQAVCRSRARFRVVAWGRRGGKSFMAAREAMAVATSRARSWIWVAAPTMKLVGRVFDMLVEIINDLGLKTTVCRNTMQEKLIVLENGSRIEGVSLDNILSAAGASVDYAIVDEAAQLPREAWTRAIMPPLADRNGQALLISSYEGEGNFFFDLVEEAKSEMASALEEGRETLPVWEMFTGPSWENFFAFPQGRDTQTIKEAERYTSPIDFLEQYGAVAAKSKEKVYHEFKEKIHAGSYPYKPGHPVILAVDPSNGINPYAVAVIQDFGDYWNIIDEYYRAGVITENISPILKQREWYYNGIEVIMDSANPAEVIRWTELGWNALPVPDKPEVETRIPYLRNQLRDPLRFHAFHLRKLEGVLARHAMTMTDYLASPLEKQQAILIEVEEVISEATNSEDDLKFLRDCAHLRINRATCPNTIDEFKNYSHAKLQGMRDKNYIEKPKKYRDHLMDAIGYYVWTYKRFDMDADMTPYNFVFPHEEIPVVLDEFGRTPRVPNQGWLSQVRSTYGTRKGGTHSYLRAV